MRIRAEENVRHVGWFCFGILFSEKRAGFDEVLRAEWLGSEDIILYYT
jgi:hypothetical protein